MHPLLITLAAIVHLALGSLVHAAPPEPAPPKPDRHFTINLTLQDPTGAPIDDAPFCAITSITAAGGNTDPLGKLSIPIAAAADETQLVIKMQRACGPFRGSWARFLELTSTYAVESTYWVDLPPDGDVLSVTIRFDPTAIITGRLVGEDGQPMGAAGRVRGLTGLSRLGEDGRFTLPVRAGEPSELYFLTNSGVVHLMSMAPLAEDLALGDVVLSPVRGDATVRITLDGGDKVERRLEDKHAAAALISADGSRVFCFIAQPPGVIMANHSAGELPALPEGTYYVTPGLFGNSLGFKVLDAARAGIDLKAAGVPTIVAVNGREASLLLDIPKADAAINAVVLPQPEPVSHGD